MVVALSRGIWAAEIFVTTLCSVSRPRVLCESTHILDLEYLTAPSGREWQKLQLPDNILPSDFAAARGVPGSIFALGGPRAAYLFYSADSGDHWQRFQNETDQDVWYSFSGRYTGYRLDVTPYFPLTVLGEKEGGLVVC